MKWQIIATRSGSTLQQPFQNWSEANDKAKYLVTQGFTVELKPYTRTFLNGGL